VLRDNRAGLALRCLTCDAGANLNRHLQRGQTQEGEEKVSEPASGNGGQEQPLAHKRWILDFERLEMYRADYPSRRLTLIEAELLLALLQGPSKPKPQEFPPPS
jgi:hypothetical protein